MGRGLRIPCKLFTRFLCYRLWWTLKAEHQKSKLLMLGKKKLENCVIIV